MYEVYWGLTEKPFENTPNAKFFYHSHQHEEALARMLYVVHEHKGAAVLTGEYGCGKTLLSRILKNELQQEDKYRAVYIFDPRLSGLAFIREIVYQLTGKPAPQTKIELFHTLHEQLHFHRKSGKHCVIVIDEAQSIKKMDTFEDLRLLLNFQLDNAFLLTIILLGSPELQHTITSLPHLDQRMAVRYHLMALNERETREYIAHRLKMAGAAKPIFTDEACHEVYMSSRGIPRRINTLCDLALLDGFSNEMEMVSGKVVSEIQEDFNIVKSHN